MNLFFISCILAAISNLAITALVLTKSKNKPANVIFSLITTSIAIWAIGGSIFSNIPEPQYNLALFWWQFSCIGKIFVPVFYSHFIFKFLNLQKRKLIFLIYSLGAIFLFFNFYNNSEFFIGKLRFVFGQFYWVDWLKSKNLIYLIFYITFYWLLLLYSIFLAIKTYKISKGIKHEQLKYLILGSIIGWIGPHGNFLIVFGIDIYPLSNFLITIYSIIFTYGFIRYRLMDIKVAFTRAGIFIVVYTLVLGLPFVAAISFRNQLIQFLGAWWWMSPLVLMAVLATGGPFIYIYISRRAEERLLKEQRRYQNILKQASAGMTRIRNLRRLLDLITHIVTKTVGISYAAIYLYDDQTDEYVLQVMRDKGRAPILKIASDNPLVAWITVKRQPLIYEEVKRQMEDTGNETYRHLEKNMRLLTASVLIPSFLENKFIGFFVLGDKFSGQIYTPDDLNVFQVLASQAALAIENAQFYEETQKMQEQIAQAEKMATIGTMADGLSHQINNRFYALSLIAGDTIDTIKVTDTSKCTPEVKEMLDNINHALERIQANVMQGGEVVKGILKYSRKGDESFGALTLDQILDGTLEMVQYKVKLSEIDLVRDYPKDIPKIKGNLVQLQEVFFNFIDNAYDAIVERRTTLKEDGYRGRITVSAHEKDSVLGIVVEDNGIGIKEDNANKVFTPFFTTKTSARRGTGLGLYVIRRIITDTHKGKIAFESSYGSGTRFILELPIAK